jgi:hypothetical protein
LKEQGVDKRGQRICMSEGLTKIAQHLRMRRTKQVNIKLEKSTNYIQFDWVKFMSKEYFGVVGAVNER